MEDSTDYRRVVAPQSFGLSKVPWLTSKEMQALIFFLTQSLSGWILLVNPLCEEMSGEFN